MVVLQAKHGSEQARALENAQRDGVPYKHEGRTYFVLVTQLSVGGRYGTRFLLAEADSIEHVD